jgi:membrane protein required for colicin V production
MIDRLAVVEDWSRRTLGDEFARLLGPAGENRNLPFDVQADDAVEPAPASR